MGTTKISKKRAVLTKDNPARIKRDATIAQDRVLGMSYREIAKKHGIDKSRVCQILKDDEIKEIVDQGTTQAIAMIPLANQVYLDRLTDRDKPDLQFKAAQDIKKMAGILPSNVTNQRITNVYNQQNNLITPETMAIVKKIFPGFKSEPKQVEGIDND